MSNMATVTSTWGDLLNELAHLLDASRAVAFRSTCKEVMAKAIHDWSFTGQLGFLKAEKSTPSSRAKRR